MEYERVSETILIGELADLHEQEARARSLLTHLTTEIRRREQEYLLLRAESAIEARIEADHE
jgi:hypothetical protein